MINITVNGEEPPRGNLESFYFVASVFGYPVVATFISYLNFESRLLSVPFRALVFVFGVYIFFKNLKTFRVNSLRVILFIVAGCYSLRLVYDAIFQQLAGADYALSFFVSASLMPAIALTVSEKKLNSKNIAKLTLAFGSFTCFAFLIGGSLGKFGDADLTEATGRLSTTSLNPITLASLGVTVILCGMVLWSTSSRIAKLFIFFSGAVAISVIISSGSKGPAVSLIICGVIWLVRQNKFGLLCLLIFCLFLGWSSLGEENPLAQRVLYARDDASSLERIDMIRDSIEQIATAPFFGSAYVELNSGIYPHNIFLEACLAVGLPVAFLFFILVSFSTYQAWLALGSIKNSLIGLLYLQALVSALTSGSLFGLTLFWVCISLMLLGGTKKFRRSVSR